MTCFVLVCFALKVENGAEMRQMIDDHVLSMVTNDQLYRLETLIIERYDHIVDIRGTKRNKTAIEIAEVKQYRHIIRFLKELDKYQVVLSLAYCSSYVQIQDMIHNADTMSSPQS